MAEQSLSPSILKSVKKSLNIAPDYSAFDSDIILLINSSFAKLCQLGVGPKEGFSIEDESSKWEEFVSDDRLANVKKFVMLEARVAFDPPNGSVLTSFENQIKEVEWRLNIAAEEIADE